MAPSDRLARNRLGKVTAAWSLLGLILLAAASARLEAQSAGSSSSVSTGVSAPGPGTPVTISPTPPHDDPPSIVNQPRSHRLASGTSFVLSVSASGNNLAYQWALEGKPIAGAVASSYTVFGSSASDFGAYTVTVSNAQGSVTSAPAIIQLGTGIPGFLSNLSARSEIGNTSLTGGFSVGGQGTGQFLIRGVGYSLASFGVPNPAWVTDLEVYSSSGANLATFTGWTAAVAADSNSVGAFPLDPHGLDSAGELTLSAGTYTAQPDGLRRLSGTAMIEFYDRGLGTGSARLMNLSALGEAGTNSIVAGFYIGGNTDKTVLIRGVGPSLAGFGIANAVSGVSLSIAATANSGFAANNAWGGSAALSTAFKRTGAFPLAVSSNDAALLMTLPPGGYTLVVSSDGAGEGKAMVEIYDVP